MTLREAAGRLLDGLRSSPAADVAARLMATNPVESAFRLAAQAFLAGLPLLIATAAFAPPDLRDLMADSLRAVIGINADTLDMVRQTYNAAGPVSDTSGAAGILVALVSATALSRALQKVCERCWGLRKAGVRVVAWRWLVWLLVWLVVLFAQAPLRAGFGAGAVPGFVFTAVVSVLLWWWTQHVLLSARIGWLPLLPGAVLTGLATVLLGYASHRLMPRAMQRSYDEFGPLGPVFTLLSWLITVFIVVVAGLAVGAMAGSSPWYQKLTGRPAEPGGAAGPASPAAGDVAATARSDSRNHRRPR